LVEVMLAIPPGIRTALCAKEISASERRLSRFGEQTRCIVNARRAMVVMVWMAAATAACSSMVEEAGRALLDAGRQEMREANLPSAAASLDALAERYDAEVQTSRKIRDLLALEERGESAAAEIAEPWLRHDEPRLRHAAIRALRADRSAQASGALAERLREDQAVENRIAAALLLIERSDDVAWDAIHTAALGDGAAAVRRAIAERLAGRSDARSLALLGEIRGSDSDPTVREAATPSAVVATEQP
jgi:hypothetical protein